MKKLLSGTASAALLAAAFTAGAAHAQNQQAAPSAAARPKGDQSLASTPTTVDEIVVTAQKRKQNLQDVPIVVTVVNHQLLQDSGVHDIKELTLLTPGLLVTSTTSETSTTARIRGIGTVGDNPGLESSVGVVIDGVYRARDGVGFGDLGDVDQIEVLKGPQGTLFGKSTSAGVINVTTAEPKFTFGGNAEFTASNYDGYGGSAEVWGPITNQLAGSLYFADRSRGGFYDVDTAPPRTGTSDNNRNFYTLRGQLLWKPSEEFTSRLIVDYTHRDEDCCGAVIVRGGPSQALVAALGGNDGNPADPYARQEYANRPDGQNVRDAGVSLQSDWRIGPGSLTSITAYRDSKTTYGFDADWSTADIDYLPFNNSNSTEFRTFSQELRYAGKTDRLDYLVGAFYSNEQLLQNTSVLVGNDFTPYLSLLFSDLVTGTPSVSFLQNGLTFPYVGGVNYASGSGSVDRYHQYDDTYALFTNESLHVTSKFDINVGLRYTIDDKTLNTNSTNIGGGAGCGAANTAFGILQSVNPGAATALASVDETMCLPFLSPGYNDFTDHQSEQESALTGTAKLLYKWDPHLLTYLSYARGYKAGGFNLDREECTIGQPGCAPGSAAAVTPLTNTQIPAEYNDSYEAGVKSTLFDRKLLLNATLFYQNYTNFQLNTFNGFIFVVDSVPDIISQGVDADFVWFAMPGLTFQGGLTVADTRYHLTDSQLAALALKTGFLGSTGSRLSLAPLYSSSLSATYTRHLTDAYDARFNVGVKYNSDYNTGSDLDPGKLQKAYSLVNMRLSLGPHDQRWAVEFWADNVFNTNYMQVAFNSGFQNVPTNRTGVLDAFLGAPQTYGVTFRVKY